MFRIAITMLALVFAVSAAEAQPDEIERIRNRAVVEKAKIHEEISSIRRQIMELKAERDRVLEELRQGRFCSKCGRSASQIESDTKKPFSEHLDRVEGSPVAADPQHLAKVKADYDNRIAALEKRLASLNEKLDAIDDRTDMRIRETEEAEQRRITEQRERLAEEAKREKEQQHAEIAAENAARARESKAPKDEQQRAAEAWAQEAGEVMVRTSQTWGAMQNKYRESQPDGEDARRMAEAQLEFERSRTKLRDSDNDLISGMNRYLPDDGEETDDSSAAGLLSTAYDDDYDPVGAPHDVNSEPAASTRPFDGYGYNRETFDQSDLSSSEEQGEEDKTRPAAHEKTGEAERDSFDGFTWVGNPRRVSDQDCRYKHRQQRQPLYASEFCAWWSEWMATEIPGLKWRQLCHVVNRDGDQIAWHCNIRNEGEKPLSIEWWFGKEGDETTMNHARFTLKPGADGILDNATWPTSRISCDSRMEARYKVTVLR